MFNFQYSASKSCKKEITEHRKDLARDSKTWDDFCIYRRSSMMNRDIKGIYQTFNQHLQHVITLLYVITML